MDIETIRKHLPAELAGEDVDITIESMVDAGGLAAEMSRVVLRRGEKTIKTFVLKRKKESDTEVSKRTGSARESIFYNQFSSVCKAKNISIPSVIYAKGDMTTGDCIILMEDLSGRGVQSGYFFGPGSPLNWGKDLDAITARVPFKPTAEEVSLKCFIQAARMHAAFWQDDSLLSISWLRNTDQLRGENQQAWLDAQNQASKAWKPEFAATWDERLVAIVQASLAKINWDDFLQERATRPWTLVHGDFHPGNVVWCWTEDEQTSYPVLVDWPMAGMGSGPQDIAQFLISHMTPAERRGCEDRLLRAYYEELITAKASIAETYSYDDCKRDYVAGGIGRWVWLLLIITVVCPPVLTKYFHDQTLSFALDNGVTPESVPMPRV